MLGVYVRMGERIENNQWDVDSHESQLSANKTGFSPSNHSLKDKNSKGRDSRDQVRGCRESEEQPAPRVAVSATFEELAQAEDCKEDADYVPVENKHEDEVEFAIRYTRSACFSGLFQAAS